jgi:hypothetical protein
MILASAPQRCGPRARNQLERPFHLPPSPAATGAASALCLSRTLQGESCINAAPLPQQKVFQDVSTLLGGELYMPRLWTSRLLLEIDVGQRLPVGIADDESTADPSIWVGLFDGLSKVLTGCGVRWRFTQSAEG